MSAVIKIRRAVREDMHDVLDLIQVTQTELLSILVTRTEICFELVQELADFVKCPQGPQLTAAGKITKKKKQCFK